MFPSRGWQDDAKVKNPNTYAVASYDQKLVVTVQSGLRRVRGAYDKLLHTSISQGPGNGQYSCDQ